MILGYPGEVFGSSKGGPEGPKTYSASATNSIHSEQVVQEESSKIVAIGNLTMWTVGQQKWSGF